MNWSSQFHQSYVLKSEAPNSKASRSFTVWSGDCVTPGSLPAHQHKGHTQGGHHRCFGNELPEAFFQKKLASTGQSLSALWCRVRDSNGQSLLITTTLHDLPNLDSPADDRCGDGSLTAKRSIACICNSCRIQISAGELPPFIFTGHKTSHVLWIATHSTKPPKAFHHFDLVGLANSDPKRSRRGNLNHDV